MVAQLGRVVAQLGPNDSAPDCSPKVPGLNPASPQPTAEAIYRRVAPSLMILGHRISFGCDKGKKNTKRT